VEITFDGAALGIAGFDEPLAGRLQLGDLEAKLAERLPQRLNFRSLQGDRPPARRLPKLSVIEEPSSSGQHPI
jgi:hypothetical protein